MDTSLLNFIFKTVDLQCVPYYYFKDKYAIDLLSYALGTQSVKISQLKKSPWGFLLQKEILQRITATLPRQRLGREHLFCYWPQNYHRYSLSVGRWGEYSKHRNDDWYQTSRPGVNLVLQMNFGKQHNDGYYRLIRPREDHHPFENDSHPVAQRGHTLAWARLDVDLDTGEALIEEIQNDWLRNAKEMMRLLEQNRLRYLLYYGDTTPEQLRLYYQQEVQPHERVWDEAILAAALWFIRKELGISRIYYHTFASGNVMKQLRGSYPPRSLYTKLPRRFGFQQTDEAPQFLRQDKYLKKTFRKHQHLKWFLLDLK